MPVQLLGHLHLHPLDVRDVVQQHRAGLARVGHHEGAAAEDPVDDADLEVDAADPVERDGPALLGDRTPERLMNRRSVNVYAW